MATDTLTQEAAFDATAAPRAFVVVDHLEDPDWASQVVDLPDGVDVTVGRASTATICIDHHSVSRLHARIRRSGDTIEVEDLGSRNGTRVNGEPIAAQTRVSAGDEIAIGPIIAVIGTTSALRRSSPIADASVGEARLAAEVDRSVRYHRPLTLALARISTDEAAEAVAHALRAMDLMAEDAGDDFFLVLPELDRHGARATITRLREVATVAGGALEVVTVQCPDDGTTPGDLIGALRSKLRAGSSRAQTPPPNSIDAPIVIEPAMKRVYTLVERIADASMTVLILGETGVGKEVVAEAIHRRSHRHAAPFVKLNCAALPETLLESELFGHERGAFTGADRRHVGYFEAASGGTLFLDEIGEMPASVQAKLLRVLERKVIVRVGGTAEVAVDTRVVAATHRDLEAEARDGRFRQDLLFRICGFTLVVPSLRDRPNEIIPLAAQFARIAAAEQGRPTPALAPEACAVLTTYAWPGNVRELRNAIERALVLCDDTITPADLPERLVGDRVIATPVAEVRGQIAAAERATIAAALEAVDHNQTQAARRLGISRRTLIYRMEKYGLKPKPGQ